MPWTYVISDIKGKKIVGTFYKKEWQKIKQKEFGIEKVIKKENKLYKSKVIIIHLIVGLI